MFLFMNTCTMSVFSYLTPLSGIQVLVLYDRFPPQPHQALLFLSLLPMIILTLNTCRTLAVITVLCQMFIHDIPTYLEMTAQLLDKRPPCASRFCYHITAEKSCPLDLKSNAMRWEIVAGDSLVSKHGHVIASAFKPGDCAKFLWRLSWVDVTRNCSFDSLEKKKLS